MVEQDARRQLIARLQRVQQQQGEVQNPYGGSVGRCAPGTRKRCVPKRWLTHVDYAIRADAKELRNMSPEDRKKAKALKSALAKSKKIVKEAKAAKKAAAAAEKAAKAAAKAAKAKAPAAKASAKSRSALPSGYQRLLAEYRNQGHPYKKAQQMASVMWEKKKKASAKLASGSGVSGGVMIDYYGGGGSGGVMMDSNWGEGLSGGAVVDSFYR